jgi:hypothetical protein
MSGINRICARMPEAAQRTLFGNADPASAKAG